MRFSKGQSVRGVVCGSFVVVKSELSKIDGKEIVTVKQIGPNGEVDRSKMRFPADMLVAA